MTDELVVQKGGNPFAAVEVRAATGGDAVATSHAREQHELQALFTVAQSIGRNERAAWDRVMTSCERPTFADGALYAFPRGNQQISGPSVKMAREIMRAWTSIVIDSPRMVEVTADEVHIRAVAIDLVSCNRTAMEDRFAKRIQRKGRGWVMPDERDLRELINRRAAILERNCILKLIPADVVEAATAKVQATMVQVAAGDLDSKRAEVVKGILGAFGALGATREMLEAHIGRALDAITSTQLSELRAIYRSIQDGNTSLQDHFPQAAAKSAAAQDLSEKLKAKAAAAATPPSESMAQNPDMTGDLEYPVEPAPPELSQPELPLRDQCEALIQRALTGAAREEALDTLATLEDEAELSGYLALLRTQFPAA